MAIYNLDAVNEALAQQSQPEEIVEEETSILDSLEEACDYMMSVLGLDEGARAKYVEMKAKEAKELEDKANAMPDKVTSTKSKKIGPYTFSASKEVDNKEKKDTMKKHYDASRTAAKYAGTLEEYGPKGRKETDPDGSVHRVTERWTNPESSAKGIHTAGKPTRRYDGGAKWSDKKTKVDYQAMAKSKEGKDKFMKDFGGPQGDDHIKNKEASTMHISSGPYTNERHLKYAQEHNKKVLKDHFAKKKAIKETCLHILSIIDDIDN